MQKSRSKNKKKSNAKNTPEPDHMHHHPTVEAAQTLFEKEDFEKHKSIMEDPEEFQHFKDVVSAFFNYKHDSMRDIERMEQNFLHAGEAYLKYMKTDYKERIKKIESCVEKNYLFLCHIVHEQQFLFNFKKLENGSLEIPPLGVCLKDVHKMRQTIRQFVRDWTVQGRPEREACYDPIVQEVKTYFPEPIVDGKRVKILFPGCGLARLVFDFAVMGYAAQGNEFSYFMLLASNFILNVVDQPDKYEIHPFIHNWCNLFEDGDALEVYKVPDVCPSDKIQPGAEFSMVAGEFVEVYKGQVGHWDSIVTCFFIDTAKNIIEYIETIYEILREGGVWINYGPLLYHFADAENEKSIELSWEDVRHVIIKMGFEIKSESVKRCNYAQERRTMLEYNYNCIFFTAIKPIKTAESK